MIVVQALVYNGVVVDWIETWRFKWAHKHDVKYDRAFAVGRVGRTRSCKGHPDRRHALLLSYAFIWCKFDPFLTRAMKPFLCRTSHLVTDSDSLFWHIFTASYSSEGGCFPENQRPHHSWRLKAQKTRHTKDMHVPETKIKQCFQRFRPDRFHDKNFGLSAETYWHSTCSLKDLKATLEIRDLAVCFLMFLYT